MVCEAVEGIKVDIRIMRNTVEADLTETAEILGAFEYQESIHAGEVRKIRGKASREVAILQQKILDMDVELKIAWKQRDIVRRSHGLAEQRKIILQHLLNDIKKELYKTMIERDRAILRNDTLQEAMDESVYRLRQEHESSWAETAIHLARGSDWLLDSSNSDLGDITLVRDIQSTLYLVRQGQGKVMKFEEKDIECVKWTGFRIEQCLSECAGLPLVLQKLTLLQENCGEQSALHGWIAHLRDELHEWVTPAW